MGERDLTLLRRRKIGFVFQFFNLLPTMTAEENVALPLLLDGMPARECAARASEALAWGAWCPAPATPPTPSLEVSNSGWRSPAPWLPARRLCWPTSCQHRLGMSPNHRNEMSPDHRRPCPLPMVKAGLPPPSRRR